MSENQASILPNLNPTPLVELVSNLPVGLEAETVVLVLAEDNGETGHYVEAVGKHAAWLRGRRGPSATSGLSGTAFRSPKPVLVRNTKGDARVRQDHAEALAISTALAVALHHNGQLLGALMLLNKSDGTEFNAADEQILSNYAFENAPLLAEYLHNSKEM